MNIHFELHWTQLTSPKSAQACDHKITGDAESILQAAKFLKPSIGYTANQGHVLRVQARVLTDHCNVILAEATTYNGVQAIETALRGYITRLRVASQGLVLTEDTDTDRIIRTAVAAI